MFHSNLRYEIERSKIKINVLGEGIEIRQVQLESEIYHYWNAIATRKKRILSDLLLDPFFYYELKDEKCKELSDIPANLISGMIDSPKSLVEIWFNRRKVLKIQSQELFNEMLLFPLFKIENSQGFLSDSLEKGIYMVQKTIGLLRSEQIEILSDKLHINDFIFSVDKFKDNQFLSNIKYQNQNLNFIKSDTMITYQNAFEIK